MSKRTRGASRSTRGRTMSSMSSKTGKSYTPQTAPPLVPQRIVLIGASNLTRGISTVIGTAQMVAGRRPLDCFCALGHGRSYGQMSRVGVRSLPGIWQSELWPILRAERKRAPDTGLLALITDVGNDVAYGIAPERIAEWVEFAVRELHEHGARTIITALPLGAIERFSPWRFRLVRSVLFPLRDLTLEEAVNRSRATDALVRDIARRYDCELVEAEPDWYGVDAIHLRLRIWKRAWPFILSHWLEAGEEREAIASGHVAVDLRRWLAVRMSSPSRWWLMGLPRGRSQPSIRLNDGTLVRLY